MNTNPEKELREVRELLASFTTPACIRRTAELAGAVDRISSCAAELPEANHLRHCLTTAVDAIHGARRAAKVHRRNPLTRPLSQSLFALKTGTALGAVEQALEELDAADSLSVR